MDILVPLIVRAVGEQFYKVAAEALTVTISLIRVLRPSPSKQEGFDYSPYVSHIYEAVSGKLKATDIDQVKICHPVFIRRIIFSLGQPPKLLRIEQRCINFWILWAILCYFYASGYSLILL